jgi:hypothetical protein
MDTPIWDLNSPLPWMHAKTKTAMPSTTTPPIQPPIRDPICTLQSIPHPRCCRHLLDRPRMKKVLDVHGSPDQKLVLLSQEFTEAELGSRDVVVAGAAGEGGRVLSLGQLIERDGLALTDAEVEVDYSYWPAHHVLRVS